MLDTNTVSYIVRGRSPAALATLDALSYPDLSCISAVTEGEILYGLACNPAATALRRVVTKVLANLLVLPWGRQEAVIYGDLRAEMKSQGRALSAIDMLIAAHALAADAILVTSDKAFRHVKGLRGIENWATDL